ncbi:MAG TPA: hypothetical protein VHO28_11150 [Ignavibacteriales bacterium]|nr:hypothetical protein [Ignavibacteriales bacterium]
MKNISRMMVIIISFGISSCATVYVPNAVNMPMLDKAADVQIGGYGGRGGFDLQGAAAITDNLAIMVNGAYINQPVDSSDYMKRKFGEVALGYYKKTSEAGRFDVFIGYGIGKTSTRDTYEFIGVNTDYVEGSYSRIFLRPGFGWEGELVDVSWAFRICYVRVSSFKGEGVYVNYNKESMFYEPAVTVRIGTPTVKFSVQGGFSFCPQKAFVDDSSFILNAGIVVNLFN